MLVRLTSFVGGSSEDLALDMTFGRTLEDDADDRGDEFNKVVLLLQLVLLWTVDGVAPDDLILEVDFGLLLVVALVCKP